MKYTVLQNGEALFYPHGGTLAECIESIRQCIAHYMDMPERLVTMGDAIAEGFNVRRIYANTY